MDEKFNLEPFNEESKILLNFVENNFVIDKVESVYFMNILAGHEITIYNAKKLYIAKLITISDNTDAIILSYVRFYDFADIGQLEITNSNSYWDSAVNQVHFLTNYIKLKNILFSRCFGIQYNRFYMVGYRITLK